MKLIATEDDLSEDSKTVEAEGATPVNGTYSVNLIEGKSGKVN